MDADGGGRAYGGVDMNATAELLNDDDLQIKVAVLLGHVTGGSLPRYTTSLDACQEFEAAIECNASGYEPDSVRYMRCLCDVLGFSYTAIDVYYWRIIRASAQQRCEAYVRMRAGGGGGS